MVLSEESLHERLAGLPVPRRRAIAQAARQLAAEEELASTAIPFSFHQLPMVVDAGRVNQALDSCAPVIDGLIELERRALAPDGDDIRRRLVATLDPPGRRLLEMCSFESDYSVQRRFRRIDAMIEPGSAGCRILEVNQAAPASSTSTMPSSASRPRCWG
jgi:hypothetical protein